MFELEHTREAVGGENNAREVAFSGEGKHPSKPVEKRPFDGEEVGDVPKKAVLGLETHTVELCKHHRSTAVERAKPLVGREGRQVGVDDETPSDVIRKSAGRALVQRGHPDATIIVLFHNVPSDVGGSEGSDG